MVTPSGLISWTYHSRSVARSVPWARPVRYTEQVRTVAHAILVVAALLCALPLGAMYAAYDLEQVPVDRLVANLEVIAKERPKDVWVEVNLGRAHGMAYAQKTETVLAARERAAPNNQWPFVELSAPFVPFRVQPTSDPIKQASAAEHLKAAIEHFRKALEINSSMAIARLSLGWCLEQSGDKAGAIATYRDVIAPYSSGGGVNMYVAEEAMGYLIPLLDPAKDAAEIASLRERQERIRRIPRPITPVVIPLRNDTSLRELVACDKTVKFDLDGTGSAPWTWISSDSAWLVYDQIGRGEIRSGLQLFGSVTFWMFWENGYDAMRALDDDRDGRLAGSELRHLGLWRDLNSNGLSDRGEVLSLSAYDIVSLSYDYALMPDQTPFVARGVEFRDGSTRPTWDVLLQPAR
jgi:tetratricopeptide (TPR) repeat protein